MQPLQQRKPDTVHELPIGFGKGSIHQRIGLAIPCLFIQIQDALNNLQEIRKHYAACQRPSKDTESQRKRSVQEIDASDLQIRVMIVAALKSYKKLLEIKKQPITEEQIKILQAVRDYMKAAEETALITSIFWELARERKE